jgi:hypothetical protein
LLHHRPRGSVSPHSHVQGFPFRESTTSPSRTGFPRPVLPSCRFLRPTCRPR